MIVVNLERYTDDGYKTSANSPNASAPDNITHVRFYYDDFAGSNYIQAEFVSGNNSTVQFDSSTVAFNKFKMFTSTDGINYTERKSYGGDEGRNVTNAGLVFDPSDFDDDDIIRKTTVGSVEGFEPVSLQTLANEIGLTVPGGADGTYEIILEVWTDNGTDLQSNILANNTGLPFELSLSSDNQLFYTLETGLTYSSVDAVAPLQTFYLHSDYGIAPVLKGYFFLHAVVVAPPTIQSGIVLTVTDLTLANGVSAMDTGRKYIYKFNVLLEL